MSKDFQSKEFQSTKKKRLGFETPERVFKKSKKRLQTSPEKEQNIMNDITNKLIALGAQKLQKENFPYIFHLFEDLEPIATGAQGSINEGLYYVKPLKVAIKKINLSQTNFNLNHVVNEVKSLKKLSNKDKGCNQYVSCYYDAVLKPPTSLKDLNWTLYLIMEFIPGDDLQTIWQKYRLNKYIKDSEKIKILSEWYIHAVRGLRYIHLKDIIHRDIKLENIMIEQETNLPKYVDFGLSCVSKKCFGEIVGNIFFIDPFNLTNEVRDTNTIGKYSDVWSLGMVFYELVHAILLKNEIFNKFDAFTFWDIYGGAHKWDLTTTQLVVGNQIIKNMKQIRKEFPKQIKIEKRLFPQELSKNTAFNKLIKFIENMLKWNPTDRPTPTKINLDWKKKYS